MLEKNHRQKRRRYRAVIIDGKKIIKSVLFVSAVGIVIGIIVSAFWGGGKSSDPPETEEPAPLSSAEPAAVQSGTDEPKNAAESLKKIAGYIAGFDPFTPSGAVAAEVRGAEIVNSYGLIARGEELLPTPAPTETPAPETTPDEVERSDITEINAAQNARYDDYQIRIGNETSYAVDINGMLEEPLSFNMSGEGPKVLIVHTHATEAYAAEGAVEYARDESDRSMNTSENVVAVGDEAARVLNERGIETLHDTALHDYPSFNGSYADALESIENYLAEYPSIRVVLDIHRDSIVRGGGEMAKVVTEINGRKAAQLMFVVGTDENGLYNPDWRENLKFALKLQNKIDEKYPDLMRYVNLRKNRFNGHTTKGSLIIETGSSGNSLSEAKYSITLAAECIAEFLNGLK